AEQVGPALVPLTLIAVAFGLLLWRGSREEQREAAIPLLVGAAAIGIPLLLALGPGGKDFVLSRHLLPALVPLLIAVAVALTVERARRLGTAVAVILVIYSLGF